MAIKEKIKGVENGLILKSIATAIALDTEKEKKSSIIIAYALGDSAEDIRYTAIKLPKKQLYKREDFLSAICEAESVKDITYVDFDGKDKDIYVCRSKAGNVYDYVERDKFGNRYVEGFAEIESSNLKFETNVTEVKQDVRLDIKVTYNIEAPIYPEYSVGYAIINAYNACLLGRIFSHTELQLETGDYKRAKIEIRSTSSKFIDLSTMYIKPDIMEGDLYVTSYTTEPVNVINGEEMSTKVYKIAYRVSLNDYFIAKVD